MTPLHNAVTIRDEQMVSLLTETIELDVNITDKYGDAPLQYTLDYSKEEDIDAMIINLIFGHCSFNQKNINYYIKIAEERKLNQSLEILKTYACTNE